MNIQLLFKRQCVGPNLGIRVINPNYYFFQTSSGIFSFSVVTLCEQLLREVLHHQPAEVPINNKVFSRVYFTNSIIDPCSYGPGVRLQ